MYSDLFSPTTGLNNIAVWSRYFSFTEGDEHVELFSPSRCSQYYQSKLMG